MQAEIVPEIPALVEETIDELWKDIRKLKEKEGVSETFAPLSIPGDGDQLSLKISVSLKRRKGCLRHLLLSLYLGMGTN